ARYRTACCPDVERLAPAQLVLVVDFDGRSLGPSRFHVEHSAKPALSPLHRPREVDAKRRHDGIDQQTALAGFVVVPAPTTLASNELHRAVPSPAQFMLALRRLAEQVTADVLGLVVEPAS